MREAIVAAFSIVLTATALCAGAAVEVSPGAPFARYVVIENVALFWVAIIGLIVIIRMKLKEIERIRRMGLPKDEKGTPFLD